MGVLSLNAPQLTAASSSLGGDSHLENAQEATSQQAKMFLRVDKLRFEQPVPEEANPNAAADVQELMGGKFGEISTLMNHMFQSSNFRNRENLNPYHAAPQARQRSCPSGARLGSRSDPARQVHG